MSETRLWFQGEFDHRKYCKNIYVSNLGNPL